MKFKEYLNEGKKSFSEIDIRNYFSGIQKRWLKDTRWKDLKRMVVSKDEKEVTVPSNNDKSELTDVEKKLIKSLKHLDVATVSVDSDKNLNIKITYTYKD